MKAAIQQTAVHPPRWARRARLTALAIMLIFGVAATAAAEVRIEGSAAAVRVSTSQNTIADVLSALATSFKLRYRTAVPLAAVADPAYAGSVRQVIAHLLEDYNYLVKTDQETTEIVVLGSRGQVAIPAPKAKAAAPDVVSRWR
jgi:hypothetical protein